MSENTYFTPTLDYRLRSYASLVQIVVDGRRVVETEYKFLPPGPMALQAGGGLAREGEGVEQVTITTYARTDGSGSVRQIAVEPALSRPGTVTTVKVLGVDTAEKVIRNPSEPHDLYRMFITMPTPERRYLINYGFVSKAGSADGDEGSLRGMSTFHMRHVPEAEFERLERELRRKYAVRVLVVPGADRQPRASRVD